MAAEDQFWVGGTDGNFNEANNWKAADLVTAGRVPLDGDSVYCVTGSVDLEGYDASTINLVNFIVTAGYTGQLGADGNPLKIDCEVFQYDGRGIANYIQLKTDTAVDTDTAVTTLGSSSDDNALHIDTSTNGTIGNGSKFLGGNVTIDADADFDADADILISPLNLTQQLNVTIGAQAAARDLGDITHLGGGLTIAREYSNLTQTGGIITHTAGAAGVLDIFGGTYNGQSSGTLTTINVWNKALLDGSGSINARIWSNVTVYQGGRVNVANKHRNITLTNDIITHVTGQLPIEADEGAVVAISY